MKKIILLLFTIFCVVGANAQIDSAAEVPPEIAPPLPEHHDEKMPEYPGGFEAMLKLIKKNLAYPPKAAKEKIEGTVKVMFIVQKDGSLSDVKVVSKLLGYGLEEEAIRIVSLFPNFTPGSIDGTPAKVRMVVPIRFKLQ